MYSCFKCLKHGYFFLQMFYLYTYNNPKFFITSRVTKRINTKNN